MKIKSFLIILLVLSGQISAKAQDTSYAVMNMPVLLNHPNVNTEAVRLMYRRNMQFLFDSFAGYLDETNSKKERDEAVERLSLLKKNFGLREKFPDSIAAGWHTIVLTDNNQFCKLAKVLVSKNSVAQLVVEDCFRIRCTSKEPIKNARAVITLTDINSGNDSFAVYFSADLDRPVLIDEPMQPGYVCFWASNDKYLNERLLIDRIRRDFISKVHAEAPNCLETGVPFYIMKPGKHHLRATRTGDDKESSFIIKSGMCLTHRVN
jgi:hypothetical protein